MFQMPSTRLQIKKTCYTVALCVCVCVWVWFHKLWFSLWYDIRATTFHYQFLSFYMSKISLAIMPIESHRFLFWDYQVLRILRFRLLWFLRTLDLFESHLWNFTWILRLAYLKLSVKEDFKDSWKLYMKVKEIC